MALRLRIVSTTPVLDVAGVTAERNDEVDELIDIRGLLGSWKNPSHVVVEIKSQLWALPMTEIVVREVPDETEPDNLFDQCVQTWFCYHGSDRAFINAVIRAYDKNNPDEMKGGGDASIHDGESATSDENQGS